MRAEAGFMLVVAVAAALPAAGRAQAAPVENAAARAAFSEGERNFQLGKFDAAVDAYERACGVDPQPAFLFNIALSHRRQYEIDGQIDHLARARELYRNYLKLQPQSGGNRPGVERLIAELTAKIELARGKPETSQQQPPPGPTSTAHSLAPVPGAPATPAPTPAQERPPAVLSAPAGVADPPR